MEPEFWLQRWVKNEIGFHLKDTNPIIIKFFSQLKLKPTNRVLVPLCGKTLDMVWLLSQGYHVIGIELSELAVQQFFEELKIKPVVTHSENFKKYSTNDVEIYVGDFFQIQKEVVGDIDGVYDRAALVALPKNMRSRYTKHLTYLTDAAPQLLITFEYDQSKLDGPPFSIVEPEVFEHYEKIYHIKKLDSQFMAGWLKGKVDTNETVWLLGHD